MEKFLGPEQLDTDSNFATAAKEWRHWHRTFNCFHDSIAAHEPNKLDTHCNFMSPLRLYS